MGLQEFKVLSSIRCLKYNLMNEIVKSNLISNYVLFSTLKAKHMLLFCPTNLYLDSISFPVYCVFFEFANGFFLPL